MFHRGMLYVDLRDLVIKWFGTWEVKNEVYLVTIGADLRGEGEIDAPRGMIPEWFADNNDYMLVGVTPLWHNIRRGDELIVLGDGIHLYGPRDPRGYVSLNTAVMESDADHRALAEKINAAVQGTNLEMFLEEAVEARVPHPKNDFWTRMAVMTLRYVFEKVLYFLKRDGDDVIADIHYSSCWEPGHGYETGMLDISNRYIDGHLYARWYDEKRDLEDAYEGDGE